MSPLPAARSRRASAGFTMVELMIVIAIVGVLAAIAIPAFDEMIKNSRRTTVVNELLASLLTARSEAVKRGQAVTVCANTDGGGISCTGGTNFSYGWMTFVDLNGNGAVDNPDDWVDLDGDGTQDTGEVPVVLKTFVNDYPSIKITATTGAGPFIMRPFNQASTNATLTVCDKRGAPEGRAIIVSQNGRARTTETDGVAPLICP